mgnify:CR=1 FL=1
MSQAETGRWVMLVGNALILAWVAQAMIEGGQVAPLEGPALLRIFVTVIVLAIVLYGIGFAVAAIYRARAGEAAPDDRQDGFEMDERDRHILDRSRRNALVFLEGGLALLLGHLILNGVLPADWEALHPRIESRADWVFTIFLLVGLSELVRDGSAIFYYRR